MKDRGHISQSPFKGVCLETNETEDRRDGELESHERLRYPGCMTKKRARFTERPPAPKRKGRCPTVCATVGPEATLRLCLKRTGRPLGKYMGNHTDVCRLMKGAEGADRENFYALHLDGRHNVIDIDKVATGSLVSVEVHPREVFKAALLGNAAALILVHNHPSQNAAASPADEALTTRLRQAGEMVGITVLDHIIIGGEECKSMAVAGFFGEAVKSGEYPLLANSKPKK